MKTPTWDEVRDFLKYDQWIPDKKRSTDHDYFAKTLPDGEILLTKISRSGAKTMSPGRFMAILSDQLHVGADQFWTVLGTKTPAQRPALEAPAKPISLPLWLVAELERRGVSRSEMEGLDPESARRLLTELRSRPRE